MTGTDRDHDSGQLTALLERVVGAFGLEPVPDEITERFGDQPLEMLHRLRLAAVLAGVADRLMYDVIQETREANIEPTGLLESVERQASAGFDPGGQFRDWLHPLLFRLFRMQRAFGIRSMRDPIVDADGAVVPSEITDPVLFTAGMAVNVRSSLLRFGLACALDDEMAEAQEAGETLTTLAELLRLVGGVVAPREIRWTTGSPPAPRAPADQSGQQRPAAAHETPTDAPVDQPAGEGDDGGEPLTVGRLRQYLARSTLPDALPVIVGGRDFDDHGKEINGLADAIWADDQGHFGGRLCIGAMGIGLITQQEGRIL